MPPRPSRGVLIDTSHTDTNSDLPVRCHGDSRDEGVRSLYRSGLYRYKYPYAQRTAQNNTPVVRLRPRSSRSSSSNRHFRIRRGPRSMTLRGTIGTELTGFGPSSKFFFFGLKAGTGHRTDRYPPGRSNSYDVGVLARYELLPDLKFWLG